jgi:DNA recombination protein RmuC
LAELARASQLLSGRVDGMAGQLNARQTDISKLMAERLDHVSANVGQKLQANSAETGAALAQLKERLAVMDSAQARMAAMTQEVVSLRDILANKQSRGAFGQGRMEAIVRDGLPPGAFYLQFQLANNKRPDCVIHLPGDDRPLAIDAKFPLEAFTLFKDARSDEARKVAMQRVRNDVGVHVKDIAERYLLPGETQDIALMFVPSESLYADLVEHFDDVVQKANRARVVIVSPSLLAIAIQIAQTLTNDARMRDQAHLIQDEMGKLSKDVGLLIERAQKLESRFTAMQEDVQGILTSATKVVRRTQKIDRMEFDRPEDAPAPVLRLAKGGE